MTTSNWYTAQRLMGWLVLLLAVFGAGVAYSQDADSAAGSIIEQEVTESKDAAREETRTETVEHVPSSLNERPQQPAKMEPHASRVRAVRAIRVSLFVSVVLLAMLTTVSLIKVDRLTQGRYAGRLWWVGLLLIPGGLLAGAIWAWNNNFWTEWMDGPLW